MQFKVKSQIQVEFKIQNGTKINLLCVHFCDDSSNELKSLLLINTIKYQ